jgi:site-specific DNA-methyltransferase (adenine-specific)
MEINTIYNEDNLLTMSKMPDEFVDLIITSPPYNKAGYEGFIRTRHSRDSWSKGRNIEYDNDAEKDFMPDDQYQEHQIKVLNEMQRVLKKDGSIFYNHKVRIAQHKASHPIEWIIKSNLTFRQQIIWNRKSSPAVSPIRYMPSTELIFWLTKSPCQPNFERISEPLFFGEVWEFSAKQNPLHPAPFPEELPENIIMCIKNKTPDYLVYDPYCGSGTTLSVANKYQMNYIGSEISEKYCKIARERIQQFKNSQTNSLFNL